MAAECLTGSDEQIFRGILHGPKSEANESRSIKMAFSILNAENTEAGQSSSVADNSSSRIVRASGVTHTVSITSEPDSLNPYLIERFSGLTM
jgi:hypothetical protein